MASLHRIAPAFTVLLTLAACGDDGRRVVGDGGGGTDGAIDRDSTTRPRDGAMVGDGGGGGDCAASARWVYIIDSDRTLLRFQPDDLSITPIGTVNCPSGGATPFSMSVDRNGRAWVLHQDHRIYHVSTTDASCTPTDFAPDQSGLELFGMGFVADSEGSSEETLFVAGGAELSIASGSSTLAFIDDGTLALGTIGDLPGWPELTGTGSGELWGFFPDTSPPSVRQLDKSSGVTIDQYQLSELGSSTPSAWAFAFWGGRFYVFYQALLDPSTNVWRVDPDGAVTQVLPDIGYRIVGAGVSTCAPVELI